MTAAGPPAAEGDRLVSKNIYVGNLSFSTQQADLEQLFGQYGQVTKAQVVQDRETGRSRGFGFVEMADGAEEAIQALNGFEYQGRRLTVNEAQPRESRPRTGGGSGGYGGGGSGGGGTAAVAGAEADTAGGRAVGTAAAAGAGRVAAGTNR